MTTSCTVVNDDSSPSITYSERAGFNVAHRQLIRQEELERVLPYLPAGASILEVGAGAGWQARLLFEKGFQVKAIDIPSSNYQALRQWHVISFDGHHIPLDDQSVDVVFSSNVLEHIPHIEEFQKEMQRVLRPGGIAVHVMPTATWRTYTTLSFFVKRLLQVLGLYARASDYSGPHGGRLIGGGKSFIKRLRRGLFAPVHGVRGNLITETYYFSARYWTSLFQRTGWHIEKVAPNELFYTGNRVCGARLSLSARCVLSRWVGSSCKIYLLRKSEYAADSSTSLYHRPLSGWGAAHAAETRIQSSPQ